MLILTGYKHDEYMLLEQLVDILASVFAQKELKNKEQLVEDLITIYIKIRAMRNKHLAGEIV